MAISFAVAAAILPASMKLARWIEMELVLFVWWTIVGATLTVLLYRGFRIRDDYVFFLPWSTPPSEKGKKRSIGGSATAAATSGAATAAPASTAKA